MWGGIFLQTIGMAVCLVFHGAGLPCYASIDWSDIARLELLLGSLGLLIMLPTENERNQPHEVII
jgi:hypothetical protein